MTPLDTATLPSHLDMKSLETKWSERWDASELYAFDNSGSEPLFSVDTPPPTVSGSLHIGHIFSYTQTDVIVRFQRMNGRKVFYPMGWDDNGLPTERRVQQVYNVYADPHLVETPFTAEQVANFEPFAKPRGVSRENFIRLCLRLTRSDEQIFKSLWKRIGLSVDWNAEYSTIDTQSRRLAQSSFLQLYHKGHIYNAFAPTIWDIDFRTAIAQAELEDRVVKTMFYKLRFEVDHGAENIVIATSRPELLAACVAVVVHPDDSRYKKFIGRTAISPLFSVPIPIYASTLVDPDKGTGAVMVCTFGDTRDIAWWKEYSLPLRHIIDKTGRLLPIEFGASQEWPSLHPESAQKVYDKLTGLTTRKAAATIIEILREHDAIYSSSRHLVGEPEEFEHSVKYYEKGSNPVEYIPTRQWFVRLTDKRDLLLEAAQQLKWYPPQMAHRMHAWIENINADWCISRQRFFGVPIPAWYPLLSDGSANYSTPLVPQHLELPVDPLNMPLDAVRDLTGCSGSVVADPDVLDTWFTSSLTPQIAVASLGRMLPTKISLPMSIRPQSHEIIRTWAFYTLLKSILQEGVIPWNNVVISGWVLDPDRKKMSKSKGNVIVPDNLIDEHGADGVRYWAAHARIGVDTALDPLVMKKGKRLATKLYNAGKYVLTKNVPQIAIVNDIDKSFLCVLADTVKQCTDSLRQFDGAGALAALETFFWGGFTDTYIELTKSRAVGEDSEEKVSVLSTLYLAYDVVLRLFAPFLPYTTEEMWSLGYSKKSPSIHLAPWPSYLELAEYTDGHDDRIFNLAMLAQREINKGKSSLTSTEGTGAYHASIQADHGTAAVLTRIRAEILSATRCEQLVISPKDNDERESIIVEVTKK